MKQYPLIFICLIFFLFSCSKKTVPVQNTPSTTVTKNNPPVIKISNPDTVALKKADSSIVTTVPAKVVPKKTIEETPKVITVNDKAAKKTIDGRYYYDLMGHRYWRNNKDGKYYLYNKSMQNDPDFKKQ